jgi:hypothetical protein
MRWILELSHTEARAFFLKGDSIMDTIKIFLIRRNQRIGNNTLILYKPFILCEVSQRLKCLRLWQQKNGIR